MGPKKKGNKKNDDWDADLGETVDPIAQATADAKAEEAAKDVEDGEADGEATGGGGLLAALKKNRGNKAKKGKVVEDVVAGEDPAELNGVNGVDGTATPADQDLSSKAPQEADLDNDEAFAQPQKKANKQQQQQKGAKAAAKQDGEEDGGDSGLKSKKEKEKEKKEREKQRKKEQVRATPV